MLMTAIFKLLSRPCGEKPYTGILLMCVARGCSCIRFVGYCA